MVATLNSVSKPSLYSDENVSIPTELDAHSKVFELRTIGDARTALGRLRQLRHDFEATTEGRVPEGHETLVPPALPGKGEEMLAGLSNIQRMRTIRREIAFLEDLMVRIAEREFEMEEVRYRLYLAAIGEWTEYGSGHRAI